MKLSALEISLRNKAKQIIDFLPDDTQQALRVLSVCYASVVLAVGATDDDAIEYVRKALVRIRQGETELTQ